MRDNSLDKVIGQITTLAQTPLESAYSMPAGAYTSPELHQLELERIFAHDWLCAGLAKEIPNPGDYLTYSIGEQPIFCARQSDGTIRSFSNVCRHRMMVLLTGHGSCKRIVCPYHAWTYDIGGQLIGAPHMEKSNSFNKSAISLPEIRTEIWNGWIYVTLNEDAEPLSSQLDALDAEIERFQMQHYIPMVTEDHIWQTNWKLLCENFMEGYHLPVAHKNTVGAWFNSNASTFPEYPHAAFTYQTFTKSEGAIYGRAHEDNTRLSGHWRYTSIMPTVFPSHMYVLAPDHLWYLSLQPKGIDEVRIRFGAALAPERHASLDDPETAMAELVAFFAHVNAEDREMVEGIYRGLQSPLATPGPLCWLEREIHDFIGYLARRLTASPNKNRQVA